METGGLLKTAKTEAFAGETRLKAVKGGDRAMDEKKEYRVLITETLQKTVIVEAASEQEAHRRVSDAWKNAEYILDAECFQGVEFHVVGETDADEADKRVERVERKGGDGDA